MFLTNRFITDKQLEYIKSIVNLKPVLKCNNICISNIQTISSPLLKWKTIYFDLIKVQLKVTTAVSVRLEIPIYIIRFSIYSITVKYNVFKKEFFQVMELNI